jgi:hypothetical protein
MKWLWTALRPHPSHSAAAGTPEIVGRPESGSANRPAANPDGLSESI